MIVSHMTTYQKMARITHALDVNLLADILHYLLGRSAGNPAEFFQKK